MAGQARTASALPELSPSAVYSPASLFEVVGVYKAVPIPDKILPVVISEKKRAGALLCTEIPTPGSSAEIRRDQA